MMLLRSAGIRLSKKRIIAVVGVSITVSIPISRRAMLSYFLVAGEIA